PTSVRVTFVDPQGKPVAGMRVTPTMVLGRGTETLRWFALSRQLSEELTRRTDEEGGCTFDAMPRGAVLRLKIDDLRFVQLSFKDGVALSRDAAVTPAATIRLMPGATIAGTVAYGPTGKPAPGVRIVAQAISMSGGMGGGG